jgi:hypothetical protein
MCGKDAIIRQDYDTKNDKEHKPQNNPNSDMLVEQINGTCYTFDTADCAMMFKRFSSVYGSSFADE